MKKIRFGVVGTNFITDWVLAGAQQDERFELTAVCSRKQETADLFASKYNIPYTFTSVEAMASSDVIDAVYIASPNFKHAEQSICCMSHGKHVLCEKPLASNAQEAKMMIEASEKYQVTLMEAMKPTMTPNFKSLKANLSKVGVVRRYFSSYCQYSSRYDRFKAGELMNAFNPAYSNGAMMDIGIYTLYPMIVLFGKPERVEASGLILSSGVDGQGAINFIYPEMNATILYSKIADSFLPTEIQGESGILNVDRINIIKKVTFYPRVEKKGGRGEDFKPIELTQPTLKDEYFYEVEEFINLIEANKRESEINSHLHSLQTLEVIDEIRKQLGVRYPADK